MQEWEKTRRLESSDSNVLKFVFEKPDAVAESVLYRYPTYQKRTVICCSTQSGCPVGCRFCGAGDQFVRSLTAREIASQPEYLLSQVDCDANSIERLQIMFMSMGEPLLNLKNLIPALRELHRSYPAAALLISTIGPRIDYGPLVEISQEIPTIGLQFSVHESTDEARNRLIPFAGKLTLDEIAEAGFQWYNATGRKPFFNYCAGPHNSSQADADRLADIFPADVWNATISVICEREENMAAANHRQRSLACEFRALLDAKGFNTRTFDPAGQDDIGGGCGQLFHVQNWMKIHSELCRPSVGFGLPVIHMPTTASANPVAG